MSKWFKYIFFKLLKRIINEKGIKKIQFIKITIKYLKKIIYLSSSSIIKYPKLNIIGEIIIIEQLKINNICWKNTFLWFKTSNTEIPNPIILTENPEIIEIIKELKKAFMKLISKKILLKSLLKKLKKINIIGENKNKVNIRIKIKSEIITNWMSLWGCE